MASWSTAYINDLPDSAFACVRGSDRFYPHHDASGALDLPHLRAALSRIGDPSNEQCGKAHLEAHAEAADIGGGKALLPVKAQLMDDAEEAAWFAGRTSRRLLAIPFGGPIPSPTSARGVDLDGEFFDEATDIFGPHRVLRQERDRLVDFHHGKSKLMARTVIGKATLDDEPDDEGWWVDFWFKAGEERVRLVKALQQRGAQLFGSSEPVKASVEIEPNGHIRVWPFLFETVSTSPQNTYSVFRAKAALEGATDAGITVSEAMRSLLSDAADLDAHLRRTSGAGPGDDVAKAGRELSGTNEALIADAIEELREKYGLIAPKLAALLERLRNRERTDTRDG